MLPGSVGFPHGMTFSNGRRDLEDKFCLLSPPDDGPYVTSQGWCSKIWPGSLGAGRCEAPSSPFLLPHLTYFDPRSYLCVEFPLSKTHKPLASGCSLVPAVVSESRPLNGVLELCYKGLYANDEWESTTSGRWWHSKD